MIAIRAKHKSEEKYVSICFAILTEYLSWSAPVESDEGKKGGASEEGEEEVVFLSGDGYCTVEVIELLCRSCMLPALASYLLNDSGEGGEQGGRVDGREEEEGRWVGGGRDRWGKEGGAHYITCLVITYISTVLDICKHIELYQTMLNVVSSLARNPATHHLLTLPVFSAGDSADHTVTSLSSLVAKLRDIAIVYQKTAK